MTNGEQREASPAQRPGTRPADTGTALRPAVRAWPAVGGVSLILAGAAHGPTTVIVCAVLASLVLLAPAVTPQRSEDRLRLWLALAAKSAHRSASRRAPVRGDEGRDNRAPGRA